MGLSPATILGGCSSAPMREKIGLPMVFLFIVGMVALGIDMIFRPRQHLRGYVGGQIYRELKELQIQILGGFLAVAGSGAVYGFALEVWTNCFD